LFGVTHFPGHVRHADFGVAQVPFDGVSADPVEDLGEGGVFRGELALQRPGMHVELGCDHIDGSSAGGQERTDDGANRCDDAGFGSSDGREVLHDGLVCQPVLVDRSAQVCGSHGETGGRLFEHWSATELLCVLPGRRERAVRQVNRQRRVLGAEQKPQYLQRCPGCF
jgi:hypothetical protein